MPLDHPGEHYPRVRLHWRPSATVTSPLDAAPEPPVVSENYLPVPCIVHPEQVREYQDSELLPAELSARITAWEDETGEEAGRSYQYDLSVAPGWKVGGFADWSLSGPYPVNCARCGTPMTLLFTADSFESQAGDSWRPVEEPPDAPHNPTGITIGRGYTLYVFRCPASYEHPPATVMQ